jgi:hypothetical protein
MKHALLAAGDPVVHHGLSRDEALRFPAEQPQPVLQVRVRLRMTREAIRELAADE